jgi:hypothetical protein
MSTIRKDRSWCSLKIHRLARGSVECLTVNILRTVTALLVSLCFLVALAWLLFKSASSPKVQAFSFDAYLSIMLTALGVMVATFAILVGLAAIWGYAGLKDYLREMAQKQVDDAIQSTLKKYPEGADIFKALERLKQQADLLDQLRIQSVTGSEPKNVANASKPIVEEGVVETPLESIEKQATPIAKYPGEEEHHGDSSS